MEYKNDQHLGTGLIYSAKFESVDNLDVDQNFSNLAKAVRK